MASIFAKIVAGEIPVYKIYEDETVLSFLDIHPEAKGHLLVIPKIEVDKVYNLSDETYVHLFLVAKKIAKRLENVFDNRIIYKVVGTDVPHAHVHLMPLDSNWEHGKTLELTEEDFKKVQEEIVGDEDWAKECRVEVIDFLENRYDDESEE